MTYSNGTIEFGKKQDGGYDDQRRPIQSSYIFSEPVRCNIKERKNDNRLNTEGGKYEGLRFTVLVSISTDFDKSAEKCRITHDISGQVGEFFVTSITPMKLTQNFKVELSQWQKQ